MPVLILQSRRVVLPDGIRPASVVVRDGRIAAVAAHDELPSGASILDVDPYVLLPGIVDTHVHINDPGRADWEGFDTGTRAAAAGGVTTVVDMPLNSIPSTTSVRGLDAKREAAQGRCRVDVGFWGGVVPGNTGDLVPLADAGVLGFKCFLSPSGVDEFRHVSEADLRDALPVIASLGLPLLVHAEQPALLRELEPARDPRRYDTWLESRPSESERAAIELVVGLAREYGTHVHIVHLAAADGLPVIHTARTGGTAVTVETCPHYLTFAAEDIADGATAFKCAPPIRSREHRDTLWDALAQDAIDLIATDHSPSPPSLKLLEQGDFVRAWGGIASLQLGLAAVWTGAAARGLSLDWLSRCMAAAPARLAGLAHQKGSIAPGRDADFVVFDPDYEFIVDPTTLHHRHAVTPYAGRQLRGRVMKTILRGEIIFDEGTFAAPSGAFVRR
jgi:allantoinase